MPTYIAIDGGTSNTRISLVTDRYIRSTVKLPIGARAGIDNGTLYKNSIKDAIVKLLCDSNLSEGDIECIIASGMITSEFGLYPLEHILIPTNKEKLQNTYARVKLDEISGIDFVFIRGIKKLGESVSQTDMIRGEETELMGIIDEAYGSCIYVLPGSHSKVIKVDECGTVVDFSTLLTGEMIAALSQNTILKDAVDLSVKSINSKALLEGYNYCRENGINNSLFKVRILKNIFKKQSEYTYSFFIGTVLCDEIREILKYDSNTVVIGGKSQLKTALKIILESVCNKKIVALSDTEVDESVIKGMIKIYEVK